MMKVSILVPVYGVEKYIEKCAVSLFEQSYEDIEYIFVNDCTPDRSIEVL
ncbi:MAG: glycosyltransferase, partial [Sodaliphilus sp.]|nr:glycosyltransferase [Sodaliphilus sp.]